MPNKKKKPLSIKSELRHARRKTAVDSVQSGESVTEVSRIMGVPLRTLFDWLCAYRHGGYHALNDGTRDGRPRKVSGQVMKWLYDAITLGDPRQFQLPFCLWSLNIVRSVLKKNHGIELSKSGVSRLLGHLGLSPQKPIYKSYKREPAAMKEYLDETYPGLRAKALQTGARIYFVDESAFRSDSHRGTTWGKIGETPEVPDSGSRFSLKLISAVSPRGDMCFTCFEGYMDGEKFIEFLRKLNIDSGGPIIVVADNASYHKAGEVMDFIKTTNGEITIAHLPTYSPELNPDEQVWNHAKNRISKLFIATKAEFKTEIMKAMYAIRRSGGLVRSFFTLEHTKYAAN
jgi:transposase